MFQLNLILNCVAQRQKLTGFTQFFLSADDFARNVLLYLVLVSYHSSKSRLHALQYTTCQDSTVLAARGGQTSNEENQIE